MMHILTIDERQAELASLRKKAVSAFLDTEIFHSCALAAFAEIMAETGQFPPDSEATKQRAYRLYEEHLAHV